MFHLSIATPEKVIYDGEVVSLTVPGTLGYLTVLANHAPIITPLRAGTVTLVTQDKQEHIYSITGGFFEFSRNRASLLPDSIA